MTEAQTPVRPVTFGDGTDIAAVVDAVAGHSTKGAAPLSPADSAEVQQIAQAMIRLLVGLPLHSDGQLTVKSLAVEAGLRRNKLTHKHTGLKDLFYALVKAQDSRPKIADSLQWENTVLKEKLKNAQEARDELGKRVDQYARIIHVLEVENHQLREQTDLHRTIVPFPINRD